jgi:hypothetical protein
MSDLSVYKSRGTNAGGLHRPAPIAGVGGWTGGPLPAPCSPLLGWVEARGIRSPLLGRVEGWGARV